MKKRLKKKINKVVTNREELTPIIDNFDTYMNRPVEGEVNAEPIKSAPVAKKRKASQPVKPQLFIEYQNKKINKDEVEKAIKDIWRKNGNLVKDIKTLDIYVKIEDDAVTAYYVINDQHSGSIEI